MGEPVDINDLHEHVRMIEQPKRWPLGTRLPLKKDPVAGERPMDDMGFISYGHVVLVGADGPLGAVAAKEGIRVWRGTVIESITDLRGQGRYKDYDDAQAIVDDGWRVD
jgi:hypothetical protein